MLDRELLVASVVAMTGDDRRIVGQLTLCIYHLVEVNLQSIPRPGDLRHHILSGKVFG
jgi:hypothetical protein